MNVEPRRTRGQTRTLGVRDLEDGNVIIVNLDKYGRPTSEEATSLTRFFGSVVRKYKYAPINYKSWKEMSKEYKDDMLKIIESKFEFVPMTNDAIKGRTKGCRLNGNRYTLILELEELKKHNNEIGTCWKDDIYSQVKGPKKRDNVWCMSKIPKCKKLKVLLFENKESCDKALNASNAPDHLNFPSSNANR
ncbi:hypothetical protein CR513_37741, partial [Mucuna pruriens]